MDYNLLIGNGINMTFDRVFYSADEIETVGVVSLPTNDYDYNLEYMALSRNGEVVAKSCVLDGLFYAAVSLSGDYTLVEVQPTEFKDEIPSWAKSWVDWMSARGGYKGQRGRISRKRRHNPR